MTSRPHLVVPQRGDVPGIPDAEVRLTLWPVTERNYLQRMTIEVRGVRQEKWRRVSVHLTRAQLYDLVGELDERAGLMTDHTPGGTPV
jgi:hypothetical protein